MAGSIGAIVFKVLQDCLSGLTPQYWQFWIGLILVVLVLAGRERLTDRVRGLWSRVWTAPRGVPAPVSDARFGRSDMAVGPGNPRPA